MRIRQHLGLALALLFLFTELTPAQQTTANNKPAATSTLAQQVSALEKQAKDLQDLLQTPDVKAFPDLSAAVKQKSIEVGCRVQKLKLYLLGIQDDRLASELYKNCVARENQLQTTTANAPAPPSASPPAVGTQGSQSNPSVHPAVSFPPDAEIPDSCSVYPEIPFSVTTRADNSAIIMGKSTINLSKMFQLNATGSGGEVYTTSPVYVAYANRLRYAVSLGGTVTPIPAPTIPFSQMWTTTPLTPAQKATSKNEKLTDDQIKFQAFTDCYNHIRTILTNFQGALETEELTMSNTKLKIAATTANLPVFARTAYEARSAADLSIFPDYEVPAFPIFELTKLAAFNQTFISEYTKLQNWANANTENDKTTYANISAGTKEIEDRIALYVGTTSDSKTLAVAAAPARADSSTMTPPSVANAGTPGTKAGPSAHAKSSDNATGAVAVTLGANSPSPTDTAGDADEASDYETLRTYISTWLQIFRIVRGANDEYFVETFNPLCGGFSGAGTSTQMQLTVTDNLNPPAVGTKVTPTNLDKVVCQPTISVSNGLGLSFIPSRTPAFVPSLPSGSTTVIQSLGYSSQAPVGAGYALQANASLWEFKNWEAEIHWSVGAMLTASSNGATTDIVTGPSFSFRRRTIFFTPVYDLGLRTGYVSGFKTGAPQGSLTSPPTQQVWKSGFGLTITFPFNSGTKNTDSASGGANVTAPSTDSGTTPKKKTP